MTTGAAGTVIITGETYNLINRDLSLIVHSSLVSSGLSQLPTIAANGEIMREGHLGGTLENQSDCPKWLHSNRAIGLIGANRLTGLTLCMPRAVSRSYRVLTIREEDWHSYFLSWPCVIHAQVYPYHHVQPS